MTIEQAISKMKEISAVLHGHVQRVEDKGGGTAVLREQMEATDIAIECMKKRIPRAMCEYSESWGCGSGMCPSCDELIKAGKHCSKCGQAVDDRLSRCIDTHCIACSRRGDNPDGTVCEFYAAKADEIRRIHDSAKPKTV